jgi:hypothetical protein
VARHRLTELTHVAKPGVSVAQEVAHLCCFFRLALLAKQSYPFLGDAQHLVKTALPDQYPAQPEVQLHDVPRGEPQASSQRNHLAQVRFGCR